MGDHWLCLIQGEQIGPLSFARLQQLAQAGLRNPPKATEELLATLESQGLVQKVARLRQFVDLL